MSVHFLYQCYCSFNVQCQCRSALQVATEVASYVQLLMSFGHKSRDICVVLGGAGGFDSAWRHVDASAVSVDDLQVRIQLDV